jgi:hypothetical protein
MSRKHCFVHKIPSVKTSEERRRYDRATHEEIERRRIPRVESNGFTHVEDECNRKLGVVGDIGTGGFRILPESDEAMKSFAVGKLMHLTLVGRNGSRTRIRASVIYVQPFAIGLEFI